MKSSLIAKAKKEFKELFLTWEGWIAWFIANVITSLHWMIPTVIGFMTKDNYWYTTAAALWTLGVSPLVPLWLFNVIIGVWVKNKLMRGTRNGKSNT
jgi:hypothetical protein